MSEELVKRLLEPFTQRQSRRVDAEFAAADRIQELEAKLAKAVEDRVEVLNQLDSARHSVDVLEKRVESLMNGKTHLQKSPAKPISGDI